MTTESSAETALDLVRAGTWFDAILCDLGLPGMAGQELFARLAQALGDRWLAKPIRPAELRTAATRIAERRDAA